MSPNEEFQKMASAAFPSAISVRTTMEMSRRLSSPRFRVAIENKDNSTNFGEAMNAIDAINNCKHQRAQDHAERVEQARKLLDSLSE